MIRKELGYLKLTTVIIQLPNDSIVGTCDASFYGFSTRWSSDEWINANHFIFITSLYLSESVVEIVC